MVIDNHKPSMLRLLLDSPGLKEITFTLFDVGCSGGLDSCWRVFGSNLRAYGFDPQRTECARLQAEEVNPLVSYHAYFVGLPRDHQFLRDKQADSSLDPSQGLWSRLSAMWVQHNRTDIRAQPNSIGVDHTDQFISIDRFVEEKKIDDVDFIKIDTDGSDFEALLSCEQAIRTRDVLGFMVECPFDGSASETANSLHNIDRFMKKQGFALYRLSPNRYSRTALPAKFLLTIAAQTASGQMTWGDAVYLRDGGSQSYEKIWGRPLTPFKAVKLACLYELFDLPDCAAELILRYRDVFAQFADSDRLLDALTPPLNGKRLSYRDYMAAFHEDVHSFFPKIPGGPLTEALVENHQLRVREQELLAEREQLRAQLGRYDGLQDAGPTTLRLARAIKKFTKLPLVGRGLKALFRPFLRKRAA